MTPGGSEGPQASERSELLNPLRASCWTALLGAPKPLGASEHSELLDPMGASHMLPEVGVLQPALCHASATLEVP